MNDRITVTTGKVRAAAALYLSLYLHEQFNVRSNADKDQYGRAIGFTGTSLYLHNSTCTPGGTWEGAPEGVPRNLLLL